MLSVVSDRCNSLVGDLVSYFPLIFISCSFSAPFKMYLGLLRHLGQGCCSVEENKDRELSACTQPPGFITDCVYRATVLRVGTTAVAAVQWRKTNTGSFSTDGTGLCSQSYSTQGRQPWLLFSGEKQRLGASLLTGLGCFHRATVLREDSGGCCSVKKKDSDLFAFQYLVFISSGKQSTYK